MTVASGAMRRSIMESSFMIVAVARNRVIGMNGAIPWRSAADMRHFRESTLGCALVVGRATFDSLPRSMPGRTMVVVTSRPLPAGSAATAVRSLDEAVERAMADTGPRAIAFAGGLRIYDEAKRLQWLRRALVTRIGASPPGDTFLPEFGAEWTTSSCTTLPCEEGEPQAVVEELMRAGGSA